MNVKAIVSTILITSATVFGVAGAAWASWATLRANDPSAQINVRSQPTIQSSTPHYGVVGDRVEVLQCVQDRDTPGSPLNWCQVRFPASGAVGWVRSDFIMFSDGGE